MNLSGFYDDTTVTVIFLGPRTKNGQENEYKEENQINSQGTASSSDLAKPAVMDRVERLIEKRVQEDRESGMVWKAWHQSLSGRN